MTAHAVQVVQVEQVALGLAPHAVAQHSPIGVHGITLTSLADNISSNIRRQHVRYTNTIRPNAARKRRHHGTEVFCGTR